MSCHDEMSLEELKSRIRSLEERLDQLRMGRRVLMNLLAAKEQERKQLEGQLQHERRHLRKATGRFARLLWSKNQYILKLEQELRGTNGTEIEAGK